MARSVQASSSRASSASRPISRGRIVDGRRPTSGGCRAEDRLPQPVDVVVATDLALEVVPEPDLDFEVTSPRRGASGLVEPADNVLELRIAVRGGGEDQPHKRRIVLAGALDVLLDRRRLELLLPLLALDGDGVVADLAVDVDALLVMAAAAIEAGALPEGGEQVETEVLEDLLIPRWAQADGNIRHPPTSGDPPMISRSYLMLREPEAFLRGGARP